MEHLRDSTLCLDSPSKHSYLGSFYMPPERIPHQPCGRRHDKSTTNLKKVNAQTYETMPDAGSRAVIAALKTLQEKMRRLELERQQAERNVQRFAHATRRFGDASSGARTDQQLSSSEGESSQRKELVSQLHSAEARCCLLEKQLDYMRKMVERAHKDESIPVDREKSVQQNGKAPTDPQVQVQLEKLEKEWLKLTNTQSEAERKIKLLELKLVEEEHQRKLVQEKAEELQRELDANLLTFSAAEVKPRKKSNGKAVNKKPVKPDVPVPQCLSKPKRMPFVAGTSTSPSHSVNANVQSVLHLLKTRQPRLCERRPISEPKTRRSSHRDPGSTSDGAVALGSLSELLLALQDELGQMSFEHQELVRQIDETDKRALREDLERELDCLVRRMEEKAAQITKLRKHQQTVQKLAQPGPKQKPRRAASAEGRRVSSEAHRVQALPSSPVKVSPNRAQRHRTAGPERLQVLRDAQRLRSNLRRQDISWET